MIEREIERDENLLDRKVNNDDRCHVHLGVH